MKVGMLGSGPVAQALASKLLTVGHEVMMGSRDAANSTSIDWAMRSGRAAKTGTFLDAASFGETLFNCVHGANSLEALSRIGPERLTDKIIVDVANILPPTHRDDESLGEQIQHMLPNSKVVKTLNTLYLEVMVDPQKISGSHTIFISGDDAGAKDAVKGILESFGWTDILDLGGIINARAMESYLSLWFAIAQNLNTPYFNIKVVR